jgi:hypothetical protein
MAGAVVLDNIEQWLPADLTGREAEATAAAVRHLFEHEIPPEEHLETWQRLHEFWRSWRRPGRYKEGSAAGARVVYDVDLVLRSADLQLEGKRERLKAQATGGVERLAAALERANQIPVSEAPDLLSDRFSAAIRKPSA